MRPAIRTLVDRLMPSADDAVVVDFETYYDADVSVTTLGNAVYASHRDAECYLVTVFGRGVDFVGHPKDFDWSSIAGRTWVAHNAGFDAAQYDHLVRNNFSPPRPSRWVDSADLAAYLGYDRSLARVSEQLFNITLNKSIRDVTMKGKYWAQFSAAEKLAIEEYASDDAIAWAVWQRLRLQWPAEEQAISALTFNSGRRGVHVDLPRMESDIRTLQQIKLKLETSIPWLDDVDEKGKPYALGSPRAIARECNRAGVPVPESTNVKEASFQDWVDEYGDRVPSVAALSSHRKISRSLSIYLTLRDRIRADGTVESTLRYYGAQATGRWAGGSGLNFQNFLKSTIQCDADYNLVTDSALATATVDIRACFIAERMIIVDLAQIEPRVLNWFVGNWAFIDLLDTGMNPYEAHARSTMGWTGGNLKSENAAIYALAKARLIALGYGAGWRKFIEMAAMYVAPDQFRDIFEVAPKPEQEERFVSFLKWQSATSKEAKRDLKLWNSVDDPMARTQKNVWVQSFTQVMDFRATNPLIADRVTGLWAQLNKEFQDSRTETYELTLPSGRSLYYFEVSSNLGWSALRTRGGRPEKIYGGLLTENLCQSISRDLFAHGLLNIEAAGHKVLFTVHDEAIVSVAEGVTVEEINRLLCKTPAWAARLPVAAEGCVTTHYKK